jgi:hypothetical protein
MKIEPLSLNHQTLLSKRFEEMEICLAEYSFTYLFICRKKYEYELLYEGEELWIRGKTGDGLTHLMPTSDMRLMSSSQLLEKLRGVDCFFPLPESWCDSFDSEHFRFDYNRNESDYLFKRAKIAEYPGRFLSPKRNLLKQFMKQYRAEVVPYTSKQKEAVLKVLEAWQEGMGDMKTDYLGCKEALKNASALGLKGIVVYIEKAPAAFILGTISRSNLFGLHFAKALTIYKGIYPFLFKELAAYLSMDEISCLNWEQDLGLKGLRQSKQSFQPEKIAHKMRMYAKLKD